MKHDIRPGGDGLGVAKRIGGTEKRNGLIAAFKCSGPLSRIFTDQIEFPQVAFKIAGVNKIHHVIKVDVNCNRTGKPVVRAGTGFNLANHFTAASI